jgi:hypothetical protein
VKVINGYGAGVSEEYIVFVEKNIKINFPQSFINCIKQTDNGNPEMPIFCYKYPGSDRWNFDSASFISFNPDRSDNILRTYFMRPEFFPNYLVAIMENGGGNYICFDYSVSGFEDKDPPVVLWLHEYEEGKNIIDLAINFETFINNLKREEEIETMKD